MDTEMNLFDIVGPVMIGPSSSHTAGAARIGRVARRLLGEDVAEARVGFCGSFARTWRGHGTDRAVVGGLMDVAADDARLRDSLDEAKRRGLSVTFEEIQLKGAHPNTVRLRLRGVSGKRIEVTGASVGGGSIEIREIDGLSLRVTAQKHTLIIAHRDTPGIIARVSSLLAGAPVNIATMQVARSAAGGKAMTTMELDELPPDEIIAALKVMKGVESVTLLRAD
ncbi:MAG: L-serine ammonia-lyase, iron-sulfur-dependent subunit beta [Clostridiales bacterium]|nr:L-serine ammonia-lyase, iron-sulfur-dependent subunit beta [Clostridiales bacterium]MDY2872243.1 L-serine ammonia-lyase, iron-sulfur-dependent subunit beta [Eubacteriales bacterium]